MKGFFGSVLGWGYTNPPMPEGMPPYQMVQVNGKDAGGIFALPQELQPSGVPPQVVGHIGVIKDPQGITFTVMEPVA